MNGVIVILTSYKNYKYNFIFLKDKNCDINKVMKINDVFSGMDREPTLQWCYKNIKTNYLYKTLLTKLF